MGDNEPRQRQRFLSSPPTVVEQVVSWLMLGILVFAAFYFFVFGSVPQCDETMDQCESSVGPYQVR
jgi:hypothetical protein